MGVLYHAYFAFCSVMIGKQCRIKRMSKHVHNRVTYVAYYTAIVKP